MCTSLRRKRQQRGMQGHARLGLRGGLRRRLAPPVWCAGDLETIGRQLDLDITQLKKTDRARDGSTAWHLAAEAGRIEVGRQGCGDGAKHGHRPLRSAALGNVHRTAPCLLPLLNLDLASRPACMLLPLVGTAEKR